MYGAKLKILQAKTTIQVCKFVRSEFGIHRKICPNSKDVKFQHKKAIKRADKKSWTGSTEIINNKIKKNEIH